ncbi:hypothetical protein ABT352_16385 [Streptosporangium sp. NPDC000563]|uniref:hypothetical protein n=1 Tax=Streptosporangium sp. NPDC000563 TaxID=3154366 RepID=UPI00332595DA
MARWKAGIASVALALLSLLVPTPPATAAPDKPTPEPTVVQECGADLKQHAAKIAATEKSETATCIRKQARKTGPATTDAGVAAAADICGGRATLSRTAACVIEDGLLLIFTVPNGVVIGSIQFTVSSLTTLDYSSLRWSQSWHYQANSVSGPAIPVVLDTFVYAEPQCLASCTVSSSGLVGGSALPGRVHSTTTYFHSPLSGYRWGAHGGTRYWFANAGWVNPTTNPSITAPAVHRCDDALTGYPSGCVYDSVVPMHDVLSYRYPSYARHLQLAINHFKMTNLLTRTQNETLMANNYNRACPPGRPDPPLPGVWSCDEYPFKSTYNGAYSQPYGRNIFIFNWNTAYEFNCRATWLTMRVSTDSGGYSACMIPLAENTLGGADLGAFYYKSRVLDGDQFQVRVI